MSHFGPALCPEFQSAHLKIIAYFVSLKSPVTLEDCRPFFIRVLQNVE